MKLLIVYGTTEGQTRKIAEFLMTEAEKAGVEVTISDATDKPVSPDRYDAAIICASIHMHKYQTAIAHYIQVHMAALNDMPSAFISVSLTAAGDEPESWKELKSITMKFLIYTGWNPAIIEQVAGALRYTEYDFFKKYIMRLIAQRSGGSTNTSGDHEYTDWNALKKFLEEFIMHTRVTGSKLSEEVL